MICSSGIGFDPIWNGERLTFGFHGIWQGVAVLYDRKTSSLWLHSTGECIDGPLKGAKLEPISGRHVQWEEWKRDHPGTQVMAPVGELQERYFPEESAKRGNTYFPRGFPPTIQNVDRRLSPSALCYGINAGKAARAYPFEVMATVEGGVINDKIGDRAVVISFDRKSGSAAGHARQLDGETLVFARSEEGLLRDTTSGSIFNLDGLSISGPLKGRQLPRVFGLQAEWYGWFATYPETTIYKSP